MINEARRAAWAEISLEKIRENYLALRALAPGKAFIACIKADAYGHGIVKVAWELIRTGVEYLGVATIEEAVALRSVGIRTPIVLLSPVPRGNTKDVIDLDLIPVITTYEDARLLSTYAKPPKSISYFAALETGMGRLGFLSDADALGDLAAMQTLPGINMYGIFSHFATASEPDLSYAHKQLETFKAFDARLRDAGIKAETRTMANSAAIMVLPESHFDIVRPGIALYGIYPSSAMDQSGLSLQPAMSVKADIVYLRKVPSGFSVSYGRQFITERESLIATIPIGYGDGLPRNTTGKARVLVRGHYAPIVGTICMDQCMVDVTDVPGVSEYDEVVIMGSQGGNQITADEIAENSGTISYEVVCRFGQRLYRSYK